MAHFAEIDLNNVVTKVLVVPNEEEHRGEEYLSIDLGLGGRWIQTSYNGTIRGMFAGVGFTYNEVLDVFLPPKPYNSWVINTELKCWDSPIERPSITNTQAAIWDETNQQWIVVQRPLTVFDINS
jgi:hypothetical protein